MTKVVIKMKLTATLLALFLPITLAQDYTQLNLPEGAIARLGKGSVNAVQYSPDGAYLAVAHVHRYLALRYNDLSGGRAVLRAYRFSP